MWSFPGPEQKWLIPGYGMLLRMMKNPIYAGAYAFGLRQVEQVLDASQRPRKVMRKKPQAAWHALIQDHHEGYISWEMFETDQRRIAANYSGKTNPGAPREGESLLQGLVLCGVCGWR